MILQQRPDQLAAVLFQTRLQLRVLKPARLLARQPAGQRTQQLARAREPLRRARTAQHPIPAGRSAQVRSVRRCEREFAHRRISMACPAESVEKIGGHAHHQRRSFDGNPPTFAANPTRHLPHIPSEHHTTAPRIPSIHR